MYGRFTVMIAFTSPPSAGHLHELVELIRRDRAAVHRRAGAARHDDRLAVGTPDGVEVFAERLRELLRRGVAAIRGDLPDVAALIVGTAS